MTTKQHKLVGIAGAIAVAVGSGAMFIAGASIAEVSGIVGLAFAVAAAVAALVNGIVK